MKMPTPPQTRDPLRASLMKPDEMREEPDHDKTKDPGTALNTMAPGAALGGMLRRQVVSGFQDDLLASEGCYSPVAKNPGAQSDESTCESSW